MGISFYFFIFFLSLLFSLLSKSCLERNQDNQFIIKHYFYYVFMFSSVFILFLVTALRFNVGTDYIVYKGFAQDIINNKMHDIIWEYELFFILFTKLSYALFDTMHFFYILISFITYYCIYRTIVYYEKSSVHAIAIIFVSTSFFMTMNVMRQMVSFSIFIFATKYIIEQKPLKYFSYILIASMWHTSAIFYLFIYFLLNFNIRKYVFIYMISVFITKEFLNKIIQLFLEEKGLGLAYYFVVQEGVSSVTFIAISAIILLLFIFYVKIESIKDKLFFLISFLLFSISVFINGIPGGYRLLYMLWPSYFVICPYLFSHFPRKIKSLLTTLIYLLLIVLFYKGQILSNSHEVVPYRFISIKGLCY